jgi:tyrosine-protein phosphatase YwqE
VTTAPRGKGTEADLASLKSDAASIDQTLVEMQKAFDEGNYNDAKTKAQAAIDAAKKIQSEVEQAKSQRRAA